MTSVSPVFGPFAPFIPTFHSVGRELCSFAIFNRTEYFEEIFTLNLTCRFGCRRKYHPMYGNVFGHHSVVFFSFIHNFFRLKSLWMRSEKKVQYCGLSKNVFISLSIG